MENEIPRQHVEYPYKFYYASNEGSDQLAKRIPTESKKTETGGADDGLKCLELELIKRDKANSAAVDMSPCKKPKSSKKKKTEDKKPDPVGFDSMVSGDAYANTNETFLEHMKEKEKEKEDHKDPTKLAGREQGFSDEFWHGVKKLREEELEIQRKQLVLEKEKLRLQQ